MFYATKVPFLWNMKHQHHLMWPWCTAVTADTARPVLQASVTLCCCMDDTSERLFSIHLILAYRQRSRRLIPTRIEEIRRKKKKVFCIPQKYDSIL